MFGPDLATSLATSLAPKIDPDKHLVDGSSNNYISNNFSITWSIDRYVQLHSRYNSTIPIFMA